MTQATRKSTVKTGDARHICRKCGQVVPPQRGAHVKMVAHAIGCGIHLVYGCTADCGFRATPSEGRYTVEYTPKPRPQ